MSEEKVQSSEEEIQTSEKEVQSSEKEVQSSETKIQTSEEESQMTEKQNQATKHLIQTTAYVIKRTIPAMGINNKSIKHEYLNYVLICIYRCVAFCFFIIQFYNNQNSIEIYICYLTNTTY